MPIANCIVVPNCPQGSGNIVEFWANESEQSSEHMTVNIIASSQQIGNKYQVMATLLLPSIWPGSDISLLQIGLSKAIVKYFNITKHQVHIVTTIVNSGMIVEAGKEITW